MTSTGASSPDWGRNMTEYLEPIVIGVLASQTGGAVSVLHARLKSDVGVIFPRWADVLATVGAFVLGLGAAAGAGYAIGDQRGAVWALCGGIVGPQLWPDFRRIAVDALAKRAK